MASPALTAWLGLEKAIASKHEVVGRRAGELFVAALAERYEEQE